ncbi:MAG: hypothetical protein HY744_23870, partial [Deltaproteobacteria bacterium]|nr:hypothetical protein [Deltaproteobacteria bacterium]
VDPANCGGCGKACPQNQYCKAGKCSGGVGTYVGALGQFKFYKVQVNGAMTDTNVYNACINAGYKVPCQAQPGCLYNDNLCAVTLESSCGNPMRDLSYALCGNNVYPSSCPALYDVYQYMAHKWVTDSACGAKAGQWCVQGNGQSNQWALCLE